MSRGKHAVPSNAGVYTRRAAIGAVGGVASFSFIGSPIVAIAAPVEVWAALPVEDVTEEKVLMAEVAEAVTEEIPVVVEAEHVVASGDTLTEIAAVVGAPTWEPIYAANQEVIGPDPDLILPGQRLMVGGAALATPPVVVPAPEVVPEIVPQVAVPEVAPEVLPAPPADVTLPRAYIANSAGPVSGRAQSAANAVFSHVRGASLIHIGGTRASARDQGGHPSGNALDYMVNADAALGNDILQYHFANWDSLGVDYIIWQQRYYNGPYTAGDWMADRGSATQNHMDHPHVNYHP